MQTSLKREDWKEDETIKARIAQISAATGHTEKRALFPLSARLRGRCQAFNFAENQVFKYARTKMTPSSLPIEVLAWSTHGVPKVCSLFSHEVELLNPED